MSEEEGDSFSVLTWNLALGGPSVQAPKGITAEHNLFSMLDIIELEDPDFICLQEMPFPSFTQYLSNDYVHGQPVASHSGYTATFVRKGAIAQQGIQLESQLNLAPASGISLHIGSEFLVLFSLHLPPTKENAEYRRGFLANLVKQLDGKQPLLMVGDMNMREAESDNIEELGLIDSYLEMKRRGIKPLYPTWDSYKNAYNDNNFQFKARFDRVFYRNLDLVDYRLIGNLPQGQNKYYLSDHFGIVSEFRFSK